MNRQAWEQVRVANSIRYYLVQLCHYQACGIICLCLRCSIFSGLILYGCYLIGLAPLTSTSWYAALVLPGVSRKMSFHFWKISDISHCWYSDRWSIFYNKICKHIWILKLHIVLLVFNIIINYNVRFVILLLSTLICVYRTNGFAMPLSTLSILYSGSF